MQFTITITGDRGEMAEALRTLRAVMDGHVSTSGEVSISYEQATAAQTEKTIPVKNDPNQLVQQQSSNLPFQAPQQAQQGQQPATVVPTAPPVQSMQAPASAPAPLPVADPAQVPTSAPTAPTSAPTYDFNQLATATMQLQQAGQNIFELFNQFGIQALNQLPKERYGEYAAVLRQRGAKI